MQTKLLSEISLTIGSGLTPLRSNPEFWSNGAIPWLKTEQLGEKYIYDTNELISKSALEKTSIKIFPEGSLSIAMYGEGKTRGNLSILKKPMTTNQACCNVVIDPQEADYEYIYYFLKTQYKALRSLSSGVRKNLNSNDIKNYSIRLPDTISEQIAISQTLKSLDKKIELNNQINAELEAMAKTLYDYWFVQFDFPDVDGRPYKSSGGKMVYNEVLKREIPEGWNNGIIKDIIDKVPSSNRVSAKEFKDTGEYPIIDQSQGFICGFTDDESTVIRPETAHVIFGDHTRVVKLVNFNYARGADGTQVLIAKSDKVPSYLFYQIVSDIDLSNYGYARHYKFLKDTKCVIPSKLVAQRFQKKVKPFHEKIRDNIFQNQQLEELRDWLLPMLMNGQVTVKQSR
ncbi:restriction endonuclease subunit S [Psychrobacter sp. 1U2]|uniref:restriction endonuclease subunit S n=1 Tax=Psychrobacter sp. 1U2 TaxID=3453577 RepID=UPI003F4844C1